MLSVGFMKAPPTTYVLHFQNGCVRREGAGLSFFYWAPGATIVAVPLGSADAPFAFQEATADFQAVAIQGQVTYRVAEPRRLAALLDLSVAPPPQRGRGAGAADQGVGAADGDRARRAPRAPAGRARRERPQGGREPRLRARDDAGARARPRLAHADGPPRGGLGGHHRAGLPGAGGQRGTHRRAEHLARPAPGAAARGGARAAVVRVAGRRGAGAPPSETSL